MTYQKNLPLGLSVDAAAPAQPAPRSFQIDDFLRMLEMRKYLIGGTALVIFLLAAFYILQLTPLYTARAVVLLDQRENRVLDVSAVVAGLSSDPTTIQNQVQILNSRGLAGRVVDKEGLASDSGDDGAPHHSWMHALNPFAWFSKEPPAPTAEERRAARRNGAIDDVLGSENVSEVGESTAISIDYTSPDKATAAKMANAIADAYVEDQLNAKFEATQKTSQWLADRLGQLSSQVQAAEAAVQQYKADNNITETANGGSVVQDQLAQINGQLVLAKSDLAEQEAKYARVVELQRTGHADDVSQVVASPLIGQLRGQETDLLRQEAELNARYGPRHPKMLDLEAEKKNLLAKINDEVERVIETVSSDVAVARAHVGSLQASLNQLESQNSVQNKAGVKLKQLEANATSTRSLYEAFLARFKEAQGQGGIETPDARVISRAETPAGPSYPNTRYMLSVAAIIGLVAGLLLGFIAERMAPGFRTNIEAEKLIGLPVLATLPELTGKRESGSAADELVDRPLGGFAESLRGLQLGIAHANVDRKPKVVLVTSSVPAEGKSTTALGLARLAAKAGQKVMLVDADLRRPSLAEQLGITTLAHGIVDVLAGEAKLEEAIAADPKSSAKALVALKAAGNPPDLLGSQAMKKLIAQLSESYDLVVIDTAPLLPVNDARVLSKLADTVLFVVRWEKTPRDSVVSAARILADTGTHVAGIALTRADTVRQKYYEYGYQNFSSYHKYYAD